MPGTCFSVYFGNSFVIFSASTIAELRKLFHSGEAETTIFRHNLREHRIEFSLEYQGLGIAHDLKKVEENHAHQLLPDDFETNRTTVYMHVEPAVDFEAYRERTGAEIKAENMALNAKWKKEREDKAAAEEAKKIALEERIKANKASMAA